VNKSSSSGIYSLVGVNPYMNRFQGVVLQRLDHILDLQAHARTPTRILGDRHLAPALPAQEIRVAEEHSGSSKSRIHEISPLPMPEVLKGICCCGSDDVCALLEHTSSTDTFVSAIVMLSVPSRLLTLTASLTRSWVATREVKPIRQKEHRASFGFQM
jgi:hypothetical protein